MPHLVPSFETAAQVRGLLRMRLSEKAEINITSR
jgi:hypothetical protein